MKIYKIDQQISYKVGDVIINGVFSDYHYSNKKLCWVYDSIMGNHTIELKSIVD